ncbi:MAG: RecX family transcriptional regulator [Planctomycetota bacterium]
MKATPKRQRRDPRDIVASIEIGARVRRVRQVDMDRSRVRVDGGAFSLPTSDVTAIGLAPDVEWTQDICERVLRAMEIDRAMRRAIASIQRAPCSRRRLIERLRGKGVEPPIAEQVADALEQRGVLDDDALAASAARAIVSRRPAGRRLIEAKLRQQGIDAEGAKAAAAGALEGRDPLEDAIALASRRARTFGAGVDDQARRRRLFGVLARRGFDADVCRTAVERVCREDLT